MGHATQLLEQAQPKGVYEIKVEYLKNGSVNSTHTWNEGFRYFGDPPFIFPVETYWYLEDDGTDIWQTRISLRHLSEIIPMRFAWTYDEVEIGTGTRHSGFSGSMDLLRSSTVTQTFSISTPNRRSLGVYGDISSTTFTGPL